MSARGTVPGELAQCLPTLPLGMGAPWIGSGPGKVPRPYDQGRGLCVSEDGTDPGSLPSSLPLQGRERAMPIGVHQGNFRMVLGPRGPPRTLEGDKLLLGGGLYKRGEGERVRRRGRDLGFGDRRRKVEYVLSRRSLPARRRDREDHLLKILASGTPPP